VYGVLGGKVTDIGPLILGQRLASIDSTNAYQRLIYRKGALVLRMLQFLLADPETGSPQPFFDMMKDFVERHRGRSATTEQFIDVANEHFARSPLARQFGLSDLSWFFDQWVWLTALPSYRLEYTLDGSLSGGVSLSGTLFQDNVPGDWTMPVPIVLKFASGRVERRTVLARGARQELALTLTERPQSVELDPDFWVLSEKTSTRKR
jgi:aminopeptidase N